MSQQLFFFKAEITAVPDNNMIKKLNIHKLSRLADPPRHLHILAAGRGIPSGMVMHLNNTDGIVFYCQLEYLSGGDQRLIHGPGAYDLVTDRTIGSIKTDKLRFLCQNQIAIIKR